MKLHKDSVFFLRACESSRMLEGERGGESLIYSVGRTMQLGTERPQ